MATHSSIHVQRNPTYRGAWQAIAHRVAKNWTQLKRPRMHTCTIPSSEPSLHVMQEPRSSEPVRYTVSSSHLQKQPLNLDNFSQLYSLLFNILNSLKSILMSPGSLLRHIPILHFSDQLSQSDVPFDLFSSLSSFLTLCIRWHALQVTQNPA